MIIIRIFSSFGSSEEATTAFLTSNRLETHSTAYGHLYRFTTENDYTHAILLNTAMPDRISLPRENVIGISAEPPAFLQMTREWIQYLQQHVCAYFIGDRSGLPEPFKEQYAALPWHCPIPNEPHMAQKTRLMSIMVSHKKDAPGHRYRHQLVQAILAYPSLPIDIYGNGCDEYQGWNDSRVKGRFHGVEPYQTYRFHIAIENFSLPAYFSEKVSNPLLYDCIPVYYGCTAIESYFPGMTLRLTGDLSHDLRLIKEICSQPDRFTMAISATRVHDQTGIERVIMNQWVQTQSNEVLGTQDAM